MKFYNIKWNLTLIILTLFAVIAAGCGSGASPNNVSNNEAAQGSGTVSGTGTQEAGADAEKLEVTTLKYQGWANTVTFPELAEDLGYLAPLKLEWVGNTTSGPQDIQATVTGDIDFGGAFNGSIINLAAAGAKIKAVIAYMGADEKTNKDLFVVENSPIHSAKDLIGKKVGVNTLGALHEYLVKDYLASEGLTEEEIKKVTLVAVPPVNAEELLRNGQLDAAVLMDVQRQIAIQHGGLRSLTSDLKLWGSISSASYVLREDFIKKNPNTTRKFVEGVAKAIDWAQTTPREEVVQRFEKIIKKRNRNEDTAALQYWQSTSVAGKGGVMSDKEFTLWIDKYVQKGELKAGQIKAADLYTNEFNPFQDEAAK